MRVTVKIPPALIQYTGKDSMVDVDASTVEEALMQLDSRFPGLRALLVDESRELRRYVNVFVNQLDIRSAGGLKTNLKEGDRVTIIPAVAGG